MLLAETLPCPHVECKQYRSRHGLDREEHRDAGLGRVPPSEHHQPGPDIRDAVERLVLHRAAWLPAYVCVRLGSAGEFLTQFTFLLEVCGVTCQR